MYKNVGQDYYLDGWGRLGHLCVTKAAHHDSASQPLMRPVCEMVKERFCMNCFGMQGKGDASGDEVTAIIDKQFQVRKREFHKRLYWTS